MQLAGPLTDDDHGALAHLFNATAEAEGAPVHFEADQMPDELAEPYVRPATDSQTVRVDGRLAGAVFTHHRAAGESGDESVYLMGGVLPDMMGNGIGRVLMRWGVERAHQILEASTGTAPRFIRAVSQLNNTAAQRLYERQGMEAVRWFEDLRRPLADGGLAESAVSDPDGIRIVAWDASRNEEARIVKNAAFADHWGSAPSSAEGWAHDLVGYGTRLDLSFMALDDRGSIVGVVLNNRYDSDDEVLGSPHAWVGTLATLREWRGKGVGTALIAHSLRAFAGAGIAMAAIGVDSDNPSGARRLYSGLGFEPWLRQVCHQLPVSSSPR